MKKYYRASEIKGQCNIKIDMEYFSLVLSGNAFD